MATALWNDISIFRVYRLGLLRACSNFTSMVSKKPFVMSTDRCRLLEMPDGIRSHIYTFLLEHVSIRLVPPCFSPPEDASGDALKWRHMRRKAFGLTQVCRQIRGEVLLKHHRHVMITLGSFAVNDDILDLYAHLKLGFSALTVDIPTGSESINLIPLVRLKDMAPNLSIHFQTRARRDREYLQDFVRERIHQTWHNYVRSFGAQISYVLGCDIPTLRIRASEKDSRTICALVGIEKCPDNHVQPSKWLGRFRMGRKSVVLHIEVVARANRYLLGDEELK